MPGLDTNVLVRWLVDDDARQSARIRKLFRSTGADDAALFVPVTVSLELEWVLRSRYQFNKMEVIETMVALLETRDMQFQSEAAIEWALHLYRESTAEFADCLHAALSASEGYPPLLTFDVKAAKLAGVELI
ncbi:MAG TPA: type II toxin-antitoxin system VapC family toxin [Steroidobacteraceae bacterium]|nr:type II toxin-antitoxin system VapC family toxin [Steroidobacteraceae bacterium]